MKIVLISTYELGRQPFGLASPAAWLRGRGDEVVCLDLSRERLSEDTVRDAELIALYVPMHTATRLAAQLVPLLRGANSCAHLCVYGLYAPVNEAYFRALGVETVLGGEFEEGLSHLADRLATRKSISGVAQPEPVISLARQKFQVPDRADLPALGRYAQVVMPDGERRIAGSTEATRGCKHLCRHCPIVPVYRGAFRVVDRETVLEDIRRQVSRGAQHITFGDPDFFNGPAHSVSLVEAVHREFLGLSYDVTIKIEHLRKHGALLKRLSETGCLFVTSAVESVDDAVLEKLDKGHTRADFLDVVARFRELEMALLPTFVPFTPWTTLESYRGLLDVIAQQGLTESVAPVQLAIRLLIPAGSRLLELPDVRGIVGKFDPKLLVFPWQHSDPRVDALCQKISTLVECGEKQKKSRTEIFADIWRAAEAKTGVPDAEQPLILPTRRQPVPYLDEPWYCCAEPTRDQFVSIGNARESAARADRFV